MKKTGTMLTGTVLLLLLLAAVLPCAARAQDFYGEGNVLIAVDMGAYKENHAVNYPEGTMGKLVWGPEASSVTIEDPRPAFSFEPYAVPEGLSPLPARDYDMETTYYVGQKVFFPYYRSDDPDFTWRFMALPAEAFPAEMFQAGERNFLFSRDRIMTENEETRYTVCYEKTADGQVHPCADFIEIECVAVSEYSTVWRYTGTVYSNRTGFDPEDYRGEVALSDAYVKMITETCDHAYQREGEIFGDPRFEDERGDRDGKAAYVFLRLDAIGGEGGFYWQVNTDSCGFDCLFLNASWLPGDMGADQQARQEKLFAGNLIHELNHYILTGCAVRGGWTKWLIEAMADASVEYVWPENLQRQKYSESMADISSRLRLIPGMCSSDRAAFYSMPYVLGPYFLRWVEFTATGSRDGALLTEFILGQTPNGGLSDTALDSFLQNTTGQSLEAWIARFMAEVVMEEARGAYPTDSADFPTDYLLDPYVFFRDADEYGQHLGVFDENCTADTRIVPEMMTRLRFAFTAVEGGGTTYAYRNDEVAPIAITGADERWYFFAVTMKLPDPDRILEISSAEELAKIGVDPAYPCGASYALTGDIDLHGSEADPWAPIGTVKKSFFGTFDGNGHTIRGLFVRADQDQQGLFGFVRGNGTIRDLTVSGSVTGNSDVGGIAGYFAGDTISGCESFVTVTGDKNVGGVVGRSEAGTVTNCKSFAAVTGGFYTGGVAGYSNAGTVTSCVSFAEVTGGLDTGGVVGWSEAGTVTNSKSFAAVTGDNSAGGIVGYCSYSTVSECRNAGAVTGKRNVGGIAGTMRGDCSMLNSYHTGTVSGETHVGALTGDGWDGVVTVENSYSYQPDLPAVGEDYEGTVTGCYVRSDTETGDGLLTTAAFQNPASFPGWDFDTVWSLENGVRPVLRSDPETMGDPAITAVREGDVCIVCPTGAPMGSTVIFAAYRNGQLLSVCTETYRGGTMHVSLPSGWDAAKAMLVDDGYRPLCAAEEIKAA